MVHVLLKPGLENFENYFEHYPSKTIGEVKSRLESNPIPTRDAQRQRAHQDPEPPQRLRQNCVWVSPAEVQVSSGLPRGQGLWVQQTRVWHKPSWRRWPLTHHRARKTISLTIWTCVGKVMSLLFNMLSRLVIDFLPRSKQASFNFRAAVTICCDFGAQENKFCHCCHCFPIYLPWTDNLRYADDTTLMAES